MFCTVMCLCTKSNIILKPKVKVTKILLSYLQKRHEENISPLDIMAAKYTEFFLEEIKFSNINKGPPSHIFSQEEESPSSMSLIS
jgi:hypothetical protein